MRKFMGVELIPALARIMNANTEAYHQDYYNIDVNTINEAADYASKNNTPVQLLWLTRANGTYICEERSVYLKDVGAYDTWTDSLKSVSDHAKAFAVEVTGDKNGAAVGNIYELDNERHAAAIKPLVFSPVITDIFFQSGKIISCDYWVYNARFSEMEEDYGPTLKVMHRPENEEELQAILRVARGQREMTAKEYPISKYFKEIEAGHWNGRPYPIDGKDTTDPSMTDSDRRLCQKAKAEYESYLNSVRRMTPDDIIMEAPKLAAMRELLHLIQVNTLSDMERDALITLNEPLSCIYSESRRDMENSVIDTLRFGIKEQAGLCQEFLESGEYYRNKDDIFSEEEVGRYTGDYHPDLLRSDMPYEPNDGIEVMDDD